MRFPNSPNSPSSPGTSTEERAVSEILKCLRELLLRVHHERTVSGDRLAKRVCREQEEADVERPSRGHPIAVAQDEKVAWGGEAARSASPIPNVASPSKT